MFKIKPSILIFIVIILSACSSKTEDSYTVPNEAISDKQFDKMFLHALYKQNINPKCPELLESFEQARREHGTILESEEMKLAGGLAFALAVNHNHSKYKEWPDRIDSTATKLESFCKERSDLTFIHALVFALDY